MSTGRLIAAIYLAILAALLIIAGMAQAGRVAIDDTAATYSSGSVVK